MYEDQEALVMLVFTTQYAHDHAASLAIDVLFSSISEHLVATSINSLNTAPVNGAKMFELGLRCVFRQFGWLTLMMLHLRP